MKRSIRSAVLGGTLVVLVGALLGGGYFVYDGVKSQLLRDLDRALEDEARLLSSTVDVADDETVEFDFTELEMRGYEQENPSAFLEIWSNDGESLYRTVGLGSAGLVRPTSGGESQFAWELVGGETKVRSVSFTFVPTWEDQDEDEQAEDAAMLGDPSPLRISVARSAENTFAFLASLRLLLFIVGSGTAAVAMTVLLLIIRAALRPVDQLASSINQLDSTDISSRVSLPNTPREMEPVVLQLNRWLDRLEQAFEREKRLSADVAHELRTPLAGLRSLVEVTQLKERSPEEYRDALDEVERMVLRLQDLVESLLHLTRLESGQVSVEHRDVDLSAVVHESWKTLVQRDPDAGVAVHWEVDPVTIVASDPNLLPLVVRNILQNAVDYTERGGRIDIRVSQIDGKGTLTVENSASELLPEMIPRLFERFVRADSARTLSGGHAGLGLTLVKLVTDLLGHSTIATSTDNGTFRLELSCPSHPALTRKL